MASFKSPVKAKIYIMDTPSKAIVDITEPRNKLFQFAGARDPTTDPWITRPAIYPYTTGHSCHGKTIKGYYGYPSKAIVDIT